MIYKIVKVKGQLGILQIESRDLKEIPGRKTTNLVFLESGEKVACFDEDIEFLGEIEYGGSKRTNKKDK